MVVLFSHKHSTLCALAYLTQAKLTFLPLLSNSTFFLDSTMFRNYPSFVLVSTWKITLKSNTCSSLQNFSVCTAKIARSLSMFTILGTNLYLKSGPNLKTRKFLWFWLLSGFWTQNNNKVLGSGRFFAYLLDTIQDFFSNFRIKR